MIRRLIEDQEVGAGEHNHRQAEARTLTAGKARGTALYFVTGEAKSRQMALHLPAFPQRSQVCDHVVHRPVEWHLTQILTVIRGGYRASELELSTDQTEFAEQRSQQR